MVDSTCEKVVLSEQHPDEMNGNAIKPETKTKKQKDYFDKLIYAELGVWRVWFEKATFTNGKPNFGFDFATARRFLFDLYRLNPFMFVLLVAIKIWNGLKEVVLLFFSSRLLTMIEEGLKNGRADPKAILYAATMRLLVVLVAAVFRWYSERAEEKINGQMTLFYEDMILQAKLKMDISTVKNIDQSGYITMASSATRLWQCLMGLATRAFSVVSQVGFLVHMATSNTGDPLFVICCVARPLITVFSQKSLWDVAHVVEAINPDYSRKGSLSRMSDGTFREEVLSGDLIPWINRELTKALRRLTGVSMEYPSTLYGRRKTPFVDIISSIAEDLPMLYYAANAILNPTRLSLTSIAMLEQTSRTVRWSLEGITYDIEGTRGQLSELKRVYEAESKILKMKEGDLPYPTPNALEKSRYPGMGFELKNVTFNYPESKTTTNALNNISCTIKPGQLVVIVGANGSGKSTLIKLLARLYDPEEGTILLDGHNIADYRYADLRRATAMLTQDHQIFPLPLGENIGVGNWEDLDPEDADSVLQGDDLRKVEQAAKHGGASELLKKFEDGLKTTLEPQWSHYGIHVTEGDEGPLADRLKDCDKTISVSGGERQRIMASRTFMRLQSEKITFLAVDEPSSALDPEGELQLFNNLRSQRQGRTLILVTHRFGHLTKHADLVICMKEGSIVESGTHKELIGLAGEYANMYHIQAQAFDNTGMN